MLVADRCHDADLPHAPEHVGRDVGTARLVTQIFCQEFFAPIRRLEARFYRYLRNSELP